MRRHRPGLILKRFRPFPSFPSGPSRAAGKTTRATLLWIVVIASSFPSIVTLDLLLALLHAWRLFSQHKSDDITPSPHKPQDIPTPPHQLRSTPPDPTRYQTITTKSSSRLTNRLHPLPLPLLRHHNDGSNSDPSRNPFRSS
jgi:hypothetical protein